MIRKRNPIDNNDKFTDQKKSDKEAKADCRKALKCRLYRALAVIVICLAVVPYLSGCGSEVTEMQEKGQEDQDAAGQDKEGGVSGEENDSGGQDTAGTSGQYEKKDSAKDKDQTEENSKNGQKKESTKAEGKKRSKEIYHVGDSLQDGNLKILYMASGKYDEESEYQQPEAGYEYIYLQFAFQNTGTGADCPISLFSFNCFADGFAAQAYYGGEKELASSLSAGRCTIGNLYFCVPEKAEKIEVEYMPDDSSQGKVRFAYEGEKDSGVQPAPDTRRAEGAFSVGDTASSELQKIRYLACEEDDSDNEFIKPEEGCSFWTLTFEFENLQDDDRQVSVHDFSCYADGKSCSRSLFRDDYLSADLPGGRKAKGTVTFEVPDEAQTVEAEYNTGRRSDARVVFTVR